MRNIFISDTRDVRVLLLLCTNIMKQHPPLTLLQFAFAPFFWINNIRGYIFLLTRLPKGSTAGITAGFIPRFHGRILRKRLHPVIQGKPCGMRLKN
jgi:hypothetical protein